MRNDSPHPGNVRVAGLGVNALVLYDVLEGLVLQSTITAMVPLRG